jgi:hypothetical protein
MRKRTVLWICAACIFAIGFTYVGTFGFSPSFHKSLLSSSFDWGKVGLNLWRK